MTETTQTGAFFKKGTTLQNYLAYPKFLLSMDLNETAKLIYTILLDRMRIACRRDNCTDKDGNVYILYDNSELAAFSEKSPSTVKAALRALERVGLIYREDQIEGQPRRIYVKVIESPPRAKSCLPSPGEILPFPRAKSCLPPGRNPASPPGEILPPPPGENSPLYHIKYKNNIYKTNNIKKYTYKEGESL